MLRCKKYKQVFYCRRRVALLSKIPKIEEASNFNVRRAKMSKTRLITFIGIVTVAVVVAVSLPLTPTKAETGNEPNTKGHHNEKGQKQAHEAGQAKVGGSNEAKGHSQAKAEQHGGLITMSTKKEFHFEVVFHSDSVQVYLYDGKQNPISAKGVSGITSLLFREPDHKPKSLNADLVYINPAEQKKDEDDHGHKKEEKGRHEQDFLQAKINLTKVQTGNMKAVFALKNLPGKNEKNVNFLKIFKLGRLVEYVCPMKDSKPTNHPGKCSKCGMNLERVTYIYSCPMHPKVTSQNPVDKCWICGAKLSRDKDRAKEHKEEEKYGEKKHIKPKFVNSKCPIRGSTIEPDKVTKDLIREYKGQKVAFCCKGCPAKWDKLSDAQRDAKLAKAKPKSAEDHSEHKTDEQAHGEEHVEALPAGTNQMCPVQPEEKVDPALYVEYKGKRIYVCCKKCMTRVKEDPAAWYAKVYGDGHEHDH